MIVRSYLGTLSHITPALIASLSCASCSPLPDPVPIETACSITDGDTIRCGDERIRLLGIDAPEKAGRCRTGRKCAPGDPIASTESLRQAMVGPLTIRRMGQDRYGRTLGVVYAGEINLSCHQLATENAIYRRDWDNDGAVRRDCSDLAVNPR